MFNDIMEKYILTNDVIEYKGHTLYRIEATRDIPAIGVKKGDRGGYVEHIFSLRYNDNLNPYDNSWLFDNAKAYGNSYVTGNSILRDEAEVSGEVRVYGCSELSGNECYSGYEDCTRSGSNNSRTEALEMLNNAADNGFVIFIETITHVEHKEVRWSKAHQDFISSGPSISIRARCDDMFIIKEDCIEMGKIDKDEKPYYKITFYKQINTSELLNND